MLGLKRMFEGSIPSLAGANSNGEKLEEDVVLPREVFIQNHTKLLVIVNDFKRDRLPQVMLIVVERLYPRGRTNMA